MTNNRLRWVLPVPFLILAIGAWLISKVENDVAVQVARAQLQQREGYYSQALTYGTSFETDRLIFLEWEIRI